MRLEYSGQQYAKLNCVLISIFYIYEIVVLISEISTSLFSFSSRPAPAPVTSDIRFPFNEIRMYRDDTTANPEMAADMKKIVPGQFDSIVAYNKIFLIRMLYMNHIVKLTSKMRDYPSVIPRGNKLSTADKSA